MHETGCVFNIKTGLHIKVLDIAPRPVSGTAHELALAGFVVCHGYGLGMELLAMSGGPADFQIRARPSAVQESASFGIDLAISDREIGARQVYLGQAETGCRVCSQYNQQDAVKYKSADPPAAIFSVFLFFLHNLADSLDCEDCNLSSGIYQIQIAYKEKGTFDVECSMFTFTNSTIG